MSMEEEFAKMMDEANKYYAKALDKTVKQLSDKEKGKAFLDHFRVVTKGTVEDAEIKQKADELVDQLASEFRRRFRDNMSKYHVGIDLADGPDKCGFTLHVRDKCSCGCLDDEKEKKMGKQKGKTMDSQIEAYIGYYLPDDDVRVALKARLVATYVLEEQVGKLQVNLLLRETLNKAEGVNRATISHVTLDALKQVITQRDNTIRCRQNDIEDLKAELSQQEEVWKGQRDYITATSQGYKKELEALLSQRDNTCWHAESKKQSNHVNELLAELKLMDVELAKANSNLHGICWYVEAKRLEKELASIHGRHDAATKCWNAESRELAKAKKKIYDLAEEQKARIVKADKATIQAISQANLIHQLKEQYMKLEEKLKTLQGHYDDVMKCWTGEVAKLRKELRDSYCVPDKTRENNRLRAEVTQLKNLLAEQDELDAKADRMTSLLEAIAHEEIVVSDNKLQSKYDELLKQFVAILDVNNQLIQIMASIPDACDCGCK